MEFLNNLNIHCEIDNVDDMRRIFYSFCDYQLTWEIDDEEFAFHALYGPGKLEAPYQKYVTIKKKGEWSGKRYKLVEITKEEDDAYHKWYKSVCDIIWHPNSQWDKLPHKDRVDLTGPIKEEPNLDEIRTFMGLFDEVPEEEPAKNIVSEDTPVQEEPATGNFCGFKF